MDVFEKTFVRDKKSEIIERHITTLERVVKNEKTIGTDMTETVKYIEHLKNILIVINDKAGLYENGKYVRYLLSEEDCENMISVLLNECDYLRLRLQWQTNVSDNLMKELDGIISRVEKVADEEERIRRDFDNDDIQES